MMAGCWRKLMGNLGLMLFVFVTTLAQEDLAAKNPIYHNPFPEEIITPKPVLTGNPRIDYIHDPNLPREIDNYDLSNYPFYKRVPNVKFNFTCDDRLDGFYASIPHECQVYHNCLFGVRYDFLCPNYTAFDQSHFICHYVNQVDCKNSELYFDRNKELYVEAPTTTAAPIIKIVYVDRPQPSRKRRPANRKPAPVEPDYYADDYYEYEDVPPKSTTSTTIKPRRTRPRRPIKQRPEGRPVGESRVKVNKRPQSNLPDYDFEEQPPQIQRKPNGRNPQRRRRKKKKKITTTSTTTTTTTAAPEYEYEYYDYYYEDETTPKQATTTSTTTPSAPPFRRRRPLSRPSANDRKQQLKIRRQQLIDGTSRKSEPAPPVEKVKEEESFAYYDYDESPTVDNTQPVAAADLEEVIEPVGSQSSVIDNLEVQPAKRPVRGQGQNARRPARFRSARVSAQ